MNRQEIKATYQRDLYALKFEYKTDKTRRRYAWRAKKSELKYAVKAASKSEKKDAKRALKKEKREYKKEAYLQKGIFLEKKARLKKKMRDALGSVVRIVTDRTPESLVGGLTLNYVLIFLLVGILQVIFVGVSANYVVEDRAAQSLHTIAASLEAGGLEEQVAKTLAKENDMNITLLCGETEVSYSFGLEEYQAELPFNERIDEPFTHTVQTEKLLILTRRVETPEGTYYLNLAKSMKKEDAILSVIVNLLLLAIGIALVASYFIGYRATRKALRPIGILGRAMEEMSAARLSDRLETADIRTELVEVVRSYNGMLDKIEDAYERQKQFVSDASHELRTPLAVIHGYADILSRWGGEDPAVRQEAIDAILSQSANMEILLERLLYIARSESGKLRPKIEQVDLLPLCNELLQEFRLLHPDRNYLLDGEATAECDPAMMRQLLVILLDNASKFTAEGGHITIALQQAEEKTILQVRDDGIGMSKEQIDHIFERFYKGDSSHHQKGYGLGLSIAKILAESQGGAIAVESTEGEGTVFAITI